MTKLIPQHNLALDALAREINQREETIATFRGQVVERLNQAGAEIILQGQALLRAKAELPHGMWMDWLRSHCPKVAIRNAERYMHRAANPCLRDLYHLLCAGEEEPKKQPEQRAWPAYIEAIGRASKFIGYVSRFPIEQWPDEGRDRLRSEMEPVAKALWPERWQ
jgi:hypothetical protein